jgi:hypothetical protein
MHFMEDRNTPSTQPSALPQVKVSIFCPGTSVGILNFKCTSMTCGRPPATSIRVQDGTLDGDRLDLGVRRVCGEPLVQRLGYERVVELPWAAIRWWVATTDRRRPFPADHPRAAGGADDVRAGSFRLTRNPAAHDTDEWDEQFALERLAALSVLAYEIEQTTLIMAQT